MDNEVVNFQTHKPNREEIEEQRRVAAEIKRELADSKAYKTAAAVAASAPAHDDDLFWDYGAANNRSAAPETPVSPQVHFCA